ncbi:hypothetical protein FD20_GL002027 [Liquorilactobacillus uvarum DSM 19971]|uniref:Uncharacterized protein n=1 Tax=Liquorilactobacillus uvarum DSM 19971 TaxID=1423812 RepID=A0A0R1PTS1_9LACO|nr:hypothetical protein FD20_GL002027 [Liquorilactobacillus uvarum DSM 19971]
MQAQGLPYLESEIDQLSTTTNEGINDDVEEVAGVSEYLTALDHVVGKLKDIAFLNQSNDRSIG